VTDHKSRTAEEWASRAIDAEGKLMLANAEIARLTRYHEDARAALAAKAEENDKINAELAELKTRETERSEIWQRLDAFAREVASKLGTDLDAITRAELTARMQGRVAGEGALSAITDALARYQRKYLSQEEFEGTVAELVESAK
jgi:hypothetical protein